MNCWTTAYLKIAVKVWGPDFFGVTLYNPQSARLVKSPNGTTEGRRTENRSILLIYTGQIVFTVHSWFASLKVAHRRLLQVARGCHFLRELVSP